MRRVAVGLLSWAVCACAAKAERNAAVELAASDTLLLQRALPDSDVLLSRLLPTPRAFRHPYHIVRDYDRYRGYTALSVRDLTVGGGLKLSVFATFDGPKPRHVARHVMLHFMSDSEDWRYLYNHDLTLLLDDSVRLNLPSQREGRVGSGYVLEFITAVVPTADFSRVLSAHKVEGVLFQTPFRLGEKQLEALRDLASRLAPAPDSLARSVAAP